ncbi:glycoside hydrolase family 79 protein [Whalleya microplaca]|nr:glycoside hydrolase family 79 protein [Whalleya microplaca]
MAGIARNFPSMAPAMYSYYFAVFLAAIQGAIAVTFTVPERAHTGNLRYAPLDSAPVGISFEFFAFPSYFTNVSATTQCLSNWKDLTGVWPPIRIGGTTQDRAQYDSRTSAYVVYTVSSAADAPASLTFGSSFLTLAGSYGGSVVIGLNRGKNNIQNTIDAAKVVVSEVGNLLAIELGNEPEYYSRNGQPIASGGWSPAIDAASQNDWALAVGSAVNQKPIIQSGNSNDSPPTWGAAELIATQNSTVKQYVKTYAHHNYPGGSVTSLMSHKGISSNLHVFDSDVAAALKEDKPYVLGETNSVSGGGAAGVSPTFGAALWTMDYVLRATYSNISRIYFHHGTVGNCQYCFWGRYSMGAPYYGAYAATALMAEASYLTALDDGTTNYAAYVSFDADGAPLRALLYNSDYFGGSGSRSSQTFELRGLAGSSLRAKRLTAESAMSRVDQGGTVTFGGQGFRDGDCKVTGTETFESLTVSGGQTTVTVKASEALLVYLQ